MAETGPKTKRVVLLSWLLVAVFYFYLSYDYIRASMNDRKFADYVQFVVQSAGNENRPAREIRTLILLKAQELSLPVRGDQIGIHGSGQNLNVSIGYDVDIEIPLIQTQIYSKKFEHQVKWEPGKTF